MAVYLLYLERIERDIYDIRFLIYLMLLKQKKKMEFIDETLNKALERLSSLSCDPSCLMIGEVGLDKRSLVPFQVQMTYLEIQARLAESLKKPLVPHPPILPIRSSILSFARINR